MRLAKLLLGCDKNKSKQASLDQECGMSDSESAVDAVAEDETLGEGEQSVSDDESVDLLPPAARTSLIEDAKRLYHLLTHKPKNPFFCLRGV